MTIEGPSLRAMTFILDRIDPPTVGVKVEGAVEVTVAEAAAQVRGKLAALVGIGPRRGDEDDDAPLALDDDELLEG